MVKSNPSRTRGTHAFEPTSALIIGAALAVHRALGPGFIESIYHRAMCVALKNRGIPFLKEKPVRIEFEGSAVGIHKLDLVIDGIVVELKAVKEIGDVHKNQLLSYMKASECRVGLLINFNSTPLFIKRIVH